MISPTVDKDMESGSVGDETTSAQKAAKDDSDGSHKTVGLEVLKKRDPICQKDPSISPDLRMSDNK